MEEIASDYGITRERVRQIGKERFGIDSRTQPVKIATIKHAKAERQLTMQIDCARNHAG